MIIFKQIIEFSDLEQKQVGNFGYKSDYKYQVNKKESLELIEFSLKLVKLEKPYKKDNLINTEESKQYKNILPLGYSVAAYDKDDIVGIVIAKPLTWNNTLSIIQIQVNETYRNENIGYKLIDEVITLATKNNFRAVVAETQNTNFPAISFYRKCGFEIDGIDLSLYKDNNSTAVNEIAIFMKIKI
ncbi:MAG: GNAT family N-acetyltransferase [Candidatus Sericytochromatia bacterium]|nr:GNAT family N-acetyltransferase [Candidatus Sericytochromatia bacterium]